MRGFGFLFIAVFSALGLMGCSAAPHWGIGPRIVFEVDDAQLLPILEAAGFDYEQIEPGAVRVHLGDYSALLLVLGDNLLIHAGFSKKPSLRWVNEWNRSSRFSRCYLDGEGDVNLEWDLNLVGGVSERSLVEFIVRFSKTIEAFIEKLTGGKTLQATL